MERYEIRLPYAPSEMIESAFPEFDVVQVAPAELLICGQLRDQSELHALFARIADMGLEIIEVRRGS